MTAHRLNGTVNMVIASSSFWICYHSMVYSSVYAFVSCNVMVPQSDGCCKRTTVILASYEYPGEAAVEG